MQISTAQIEHLAKLSKLQLSEEEKQKYCQNMTSIIAFLEQLPEQKGDRSSTQTAISLFEEQRDTPHPEQLLNNVQHAIVNNCISIKTPLTN